LVVGARPATAEKAVTMVIAYAIERGGRREKRERERRRRRRKLTPV
jgi:hypothetical protein